MFTYNLSDKLRKKLEKLAKKDKILALIFRRKIQEVLNRDEKSIGMYKNLKSPQNEYNRIHLTVNMVLLFTVNKNHIVFIDVIRWDKAYT